VSNGWYSIEVRTFFHKGKWYYNMTVRLRTVAFGGRDPREWSDVETAFYLDRFISDDLAMQAAKEKLITLRKTITDRPDSMLINKFLANQSTTVNLCVLTGLWNFG
jgi:hypothetical protein